MWRYILFISCFFLISWYAFQAIRTQTSFKWVLVLYWVVCLAVILNFIVQFRLSIDQDSDVAKFFSFGYLLIVLIVQLILIVFLIAEDTYRIVRALIHFVFPSPSETWVGRREFISKMALGLAAIPFAGLLYGVFKGRYNYKVLHHTIVLDNLPDAFEGYTLTQISDFHCGSFDRYDKVKYGIDLINAQASDVIFFTGDMVNNKATELNKWAELFSSLTAKDGVFSVLGNHDYGDYVSWDTPKKKEENLAQLISLQKQIGFQVLRNEHAIIQRGGAQLDVIGVENWGKGGFKKAGDLDKALSKTSPNSFKILLSHDPSHWEMIVRDHPTHIPLTLSGHTHGMQFGIDIPGWIKWSPAKWRYPYWSGLYKEKEQHLYVNRGFGYLAYPGRLGMWPEITVITLRKAT